MSKLLFAMTGATATVGGIATANINVLLALNELADRRQLDLEVFSLHERGQDRPEFLSPTVNFTGFCGNKSRFAARFFSEALGQPLILVDHVRLAVPLLPLMLARYLRAVVFSHGSESWRRIRPLSRLIFRYATLCITNSEYTLRRMRSVLPKFNGAAAPLGLTPEFSTFSSNYLEDGIELSLEAVSGKTNVIGDRMLLTVARMDPREREKGHDQLLRAMPAVLTGCPRAQLVFVGPGDDRERLSDVARDLGVAGAVFLTGLADHPMLTRLYQSCYAYCMPSRQEGFGLVYLEAMCFSRPCVGCFDDGAEEIIVDGETGVLVGDPNDLDELGSKLIRLLSDPDAARRMGEAGRLRLLDRFTSEHARARVRNLIEPLIP